MNHIDKNITLLKNLHPLLGHNYSNTKNLQHNIEENLQMKNYLQNENNDVINEEIFVNFVNNINPSNKHLVKSDSKNRTKKITKNTKNTKNTKKTKK